MIETERLILRPFLEADAEDVFEYLKNPMINCFACMKVNSLEEAKNLVCVERECSWSSLLSSMMKTGIRYMKIQFSMPF